MKLAGPLIPCVGGHYPTVQWNATVASQALDKYNNHYQAWQESKEWSVSKAISLADRNLARGGASSRSGKLPSSMYEPFRPRNSSSACEELSAMVHAQVNTTISVIPNKDPPYAWHGLQHRQLKWGAPEESRTDWGPPSHHQDRE